MNFEFGEEITTSRSGSFVENAVNFFDNEEYEPPQYAEQYSDARNVINMENDFNMQQPYKKDEKRNPIGQLFKVKAKDPNKHPVPMLARVVSLTQAEPAVIDEIFKEAAKLKQLQSNYLLPLESICFNQKLGVLYLLMPMKLSLFDFLHHSNVTLTADDKQTIAMNLVRALIMLYKNHKIAHTHLSSHNIMINPSDL